MVPMLRPKLLLWQRVCCVLAVVFYVAPGWARPAAARGHAGSEARAAAAMDEAEREGPLALHAFLYAMPKGGDLHNHLSGAVYAESWIRAAGEDGLCVNPVALAFVHRSEGAAPNTCAPGTVPATELPQDQHLYDELIDSFSMRTFVPTTATSGHDHFFDSFAKFGGTSHAHLPEWLDEVSARAAAQNEQYLELMHTPDIGPSIELATRIGFEPNFAVYRQRLLDAGLSRQIPALRQEMDGYEARQRAMEHCGTPQAAPACQVAVRYIFQVLRNMPPEAVFGELVLGFELASADPRFVGLNLVQPEDAFFSMRDYTLHMQMLAALRPFYPKVKLSLHAGELAPGLVPPAGLSFHITSAVEVARAERIGHGVDVIYENHPFALLETMAARHVLVEVNLTSNNVILNVEGDDSPFPLYLAYRVPVALSTDDEGVSRIDLTHEFQRAVETYDLTYGELKRMVRNSMEYSFLPGESLWRDHEYGEPVSACRGQVGSDKPSARCRAVLDTSQKAQQQWELERRFRAFETALPGSAELPMKARRGRGRASPSRSRTENSDAGLAPVAYAPLLH